MKRVIFSMFLFFVFAAIYGQGQNISLISNVQIDEGATDVWGFVDQNEIEYAVMGTLNSTRIYSLENPETPIDIARIPGASSPWRDIKQFDSYLYIVADRGEDGILIVDISNPTDTITHAFYKPEIITTNSIDTLRTSHNLYIDDDGFIYISGSNVSRGGVLIFDANTDPEAPEFVGIADTRYSHDVFVHDSIMYTSDVFSGLLSIYDVKDRTNPIILATQPTSFNFTHNAWTSDDGKYIFTTDELGNAFVDAYDISDLNDITRVDQFQPASSTGTKTIPHNTHYLNGYLYTSWYTDGVIIMDANRPQNMIQVGQYDTWDGPNGDFNGNWGAYPFLPSGLLLLSDRSTGLYVLQPNINRAAYLEGEIVDADTEESINGVEVVILSEEQNFEFSDPNGDYKTGQATAGEFKVVFSHPDYISDTLDVTLINGEIFNLDVALTSSLVSATDDVFVNEAVELFPNPVSESFILNFDNEVLLTPFRFEIFDVIGSRVFLSEKIWESTEFQVNELAQGIYFYRLKDSKDQFALGQFVKL